MERLRLLPALLLSLLGPAAQAQTATPVWRPLTDSVFFVLHLSEDQVARSRAIDAHYNTERHKLQADRAMPATDRDRALSGLAAAREKEVQGVMTHDQFEQWIGRPKRPESKRLKGTPRQ
ncbi:MAG: hypothetical protein JST66_05260 [Bacteroidetes bacterium]|nr:hypothetical protein [Bacteroidota bacterium]